MSAAQQYYFPVALSPLVILIRSIKNHTVDGLNLTV